MLISKSREKKRLGQKEQKRFCKELNPSLGCTTCKYGPSTVIYGQKFQIQYRIYGVPRIRRIYGHTVWANPIHGVSALPSCFPPGEAWTPWEAEWVCPNGAERHLQVIQPAGACKLAQVNVSLKSSQGKTTSASQV